MKIRRNGFILLVLFVLYYLLPLNGRLLWQPDETRYAEISREMLASGDWIAPHFLGLRYFEKPIVGYWINSISQWLLGDNNFAVRFGSVFSTAVSALLIYWLTFRLWKQRSTALLAAVIFLTSLLVYGVGTYAVLDPMFTLWLTAAMCCFWLTTEATSFRARASLYLLLGIVCGLGFMTKGFLALAIPVIGVLPWVIFSQRWKALLLYGGFAILGAVLITLPWGIAIAQREPDFWHYFFWVEHIQRFSSDNAQHKSPFWFYIPVLILGVMPWLGFLPGSLMRAWQQRHTSLGSLYLLGWTLLPLLFFSIAKGKLITYILPCFAPLSILMAKHAMALVAEKSRTLKINALINILFGLSLGLVVLLVFSPWSIVDYPIYKTNEMEAISLAIAAFLFWAGVGGLALNYIATRWYWVAVCPLGIALSITQALPQKIIDSKHPEAFIESYLPELESSRYILSANVGIAAGLAWELKRHDIIMYNEPGELHYGLQYPDAKGRLVKASDFSRWLTAHRSDGNISLVMRTNSDNILKNTQLPTPDKIEQQGRFILYFYQKKP